jgi:spermidine synthase
MQQYIQQIDGEQWLVEYDRNNLHVGYRIKEVLAVEQSEFQHVMIVDSYDFGRMLVLDGVVQSTSLDGYIYNEMITHVPLAIHTEPKKVLIIGGGDCGAAREVAKYTQVEQIDVIEIDEVVVRLSKKYLPEVSGNLSDPRVRFIYRDGIAYVKEQRDAYDVIIVDSSDPVGPAEGLFQREFYEDIFHALHANGLMVCQSESPLFYADVMKRTYTYIHELFPHSQLYTATVPTYPGGLWSFTLGSKNKIQLQKNTLPSDTQYINDLVLESSFALPTFVAKTITE